MANYLMNDRGENVVAWGAPGSIARAKIEHPALIEMINELNGQEEANKLIASCGITSSLENKAIIYHTRFRSGG